MMKINTIIVVGAGVMGRGIAYSTALSGYQTILVDVHAQQLADASTAISKLVQTGMGRGKVTASQAKHLEACLSTTLDVQQALSHADFVIEAVPEQRNMKKEILATVDQYAPAHAVIASNTSTISPTELGSYTSRPAQVAAMHFFNPVHRMKLVEIVRGLETSDKTIQLIQRLAENIGKETVHVRDFPGFVTSRISAMIGNEAFYMLQEGVASAADIDKAIRLGLHFPMGPLELGDLVGLDTRLNNLRYLHETLGEKFRPAPLLEQYVKAGRLGRKSGRGVYDYRNE